MWPKKSKQQPPPPAFATSTQEDIETLRKAILLETDPEREAALAAILSIVEACRRLNIPVRDYLGSVLPGLANFPINRIAELTPGAWAARI